MSAALTSLTRRELGGGIERASYRVAATGYAAAKTRYDFLNSLCGWYTAWPRPHPKDIIKEEAKAVPGSKPLQVEVTLFIRRGEYFLLDLALRHETLHIERRNTELFIFCDCHSQTWTISSAALPKQEIKEWGTEIK